MKSIMENKENITYALRRKANDNIKEIVRFPDLSGITFESNDRICPQDGKIEWFTFEQFKTLYLTEPQEKLPSRVEVVLENISNEIQEQKSEESIGDFLGIPVNPPFTDESKRSFPKTNIKLIGVIVAAGVVFLTVIISFLNSDKSTHSSEKTQINSGPETSDIMQLEMEKLLLEGVQLVKIHGNHQEANIKFSQVRAILSSRGQMQMDSVAKYITQFTRDGEKLCSGFKTASVIEVANEYYKHAAILSNNSQTICR